MLSRKIKARYTVQTVLRCSSVRLSPRIYLHSFLHLFICLREVLPLRCTNKLTKISFISNRRRRRRRRRSRVEKRLKLVRFILGQNKISAYLTNVVGNKTDNNFIWRRTIFFFLKQTSAEINWLYSILNSKIWKINTAKRRYFREFRVTSTDM